MANSQAHAHAVITSFIKFAENNPDKWTTDLTYYHRDFLSSVFPCKLN